MGCGKIAKDTISPLRKTKQNIRSCGVKKVPLKKYRALHGIQKRKAPLTAKGGKKPPLCSYKAGTEKPPVCHAEPIKKKTDAADSQPVLN
jgi:hypothetical protein